MGRKRLMGHSRSRIFGARSLSATHDFGLLAFTAALFVAVAARFPLFASVPGIESLVDDSGLLLLLGIGQMLVILTRAIDLSVAANVAFSGMVAALVNQHHPEVPVAALVVLAAFIGGLLGAFNGLLVWLLEVPAIVATLGTMAIYRGGVYLLSGGTWVTSSHMTAGFLSLVRAKFFGFTTLSWTALAGALLAAWLLRYTESGRRLYVAGSNPRAATYAGVNVGQAQFVAFLFSGFIAGLCGYLWVARFAVAYTDVAAGFELQVIAACVIGGVSMAGGAGTVFGLVVGCLFLGILKNALPLLGVAPFWQTALSGLVITVAVVLNARGSVRSRQQILEARPQTAVPAQTAVPHQ